MLKKDEVIMNDDVTIWDCPKCPTGKLIKRKNKQGRIFLGCTNYPTCTYIQKYEEDDNEIDNNEIDDDGADLLDDEELI